MHFSVEPYLACQDPVDGSAREFDIVLGCLVLTTFSKESVGDMNKSRCQGAKIYISGLDLTFQRADNLIVNRAVWLTDS